MNIKKGVAILLFVSAFVFLTESLFGIDILGHRGARGVKPENTLPAFLEAIEAGADGIEFDLLLTSDGEVIIHHNYVINKDLCTYLDGTPYDSDALISTLTLADIKNIDCGRKGNPLFPRQVLMPGTKVPTFHELLDLVKNSSHPNAKKLRLNIEIKADPEHPEYLPPYPLVAQRIIDIVREFEFENRVYYSSFDLRMVEEVKKIEPNAIVGAIFNARTLKYYYQKSFHDSCDTILETALALNASIISPEHLYLTAESIEKIHAAGLKVVTWTVNKPEDCVNLIEMGVDGIISDYPADMIELLKQPQIALAEDWK